MLIISPFIISNVFVLIYLLAEWIQHSQEIRLKASEHYLGIRELPGSQASQGQEAREIEVQKRETCT